MTRTAWSQPWPRRVSPSEPSRSSASTTCRLRSASARRPVRCRRDRTTRPAATRAVSGRRPGPRPEGCRGPGAGCRWPSRRGAGPGEPRSGGTPRRRPLASDRPRIERTSFPTRVRRARCSDQVPDGIHHAPRPPARRDIGRTGATVDSPLVVEAEGAGEVPASEPDANGLTRRGPFEVGERVQLTDPKGRLHTITLEPGREFHTHRRLPAPRRPHRRARRLGRHEHGGCRVPRAPPAAQRLRHVDAARRRRRLPQGRRARSCRWPTSSPAQPWSRPGSGSGALSMSLLRAIGERGRLLSFERREDFAEIARGQRPGLLRGRPPRVDRHRRRPRRGPAAARSRPAPVDRVVLDMLAPWECLDAVADALIPGGVLICYVATTTQLSRVAEGIRGPRRLHRAQRLGVARAWLAPRRSGRAARSTACTATPASSSRPDGWLPESFRPSGSADPAKGAYGPGGRRVRGRPRWRRRDRPRRGRSTCPGRRVDDVPPRPGRPRRWASGSRATRRVRRVRRSQVRVESSTTRVPGSGRVPTMSDDRPRPSRGT